MSDPIADAESFAEAQRVEYSQYVAVGPIVHDGALAYNPGDPVPASNVERHGYLADELVEPVKATKATPRKKD